MRGKHQFQPWVGLAGNRGQRRRQLPRALRCEEDGHQRQPRRVVHRQRGDLANAAIQRVFAQRGAAHGDAQAFPRREVAERDVREHQTVQVVAEQRAQFFAAVGQVDDHAPGRQSRQLAGRALDCAAMVCGDILQMVNPAQGGTVAVVDDMLGRHAARETVERGPVRPPPAPRRESSQSGCPLRRRRLARRALAHRQDSPSPARGCAAACPSARRPLARLLGRGVLGARPPRQGPWAAMRTPRRGALGRDRAGLATGGFRRRNSSHRASRQRTAPASQARNHHACLGERTWPILTRTCPMRWRKCCQRGPRPPRCTARATPSLRGESSKTSPNRSTALPLRRARCSAQARVIEAVEPSPRRATADAAEPSAARIRRTMSGAMRTVAGISTWNAAAGNSSSADWRGAIRIRGSGPRCSRSHGRRSSSPSAMRTTKSLVRPARDALGDFENTAAVRLGGVDGHHVLGHGKGSAGGRLPKLLVGDQVRQLAALDVLRFVLALAALGQAALVPGEAVAERHQQTADGLRPVAELRVFAAPARERFVEAAGSLEQLAPNAEVAAHEHAELVVPPRRQMPRSRHVPVHERRVPGPVGKQLPQGSPARADGLGIHVVDGDEGAGAKGHRVADGVVPSGVGGDPARFGQHVGIEEQQNGRGRRSGRRHCGARASPKPRSS